MSEENNEEKTVKEIPEIDKLEDYLLENSPFTKRPFSDATKKAYRATYGKLKALLEKDIHLSSQKLILEVINDLDLSVATQSSYINIGIIIRSLYGKNVDELIKTRENNKIPIAESTKIKNDNLKLPSYQDLLYYLNKLFMEKDCIGYIINYLLINYAVRNADVNFDIILKKRESKANMEINYMWLSPTGKAVWIRRQYKTVGVYGKQEITITDKRFIEALKQCKDKVLIPHYNNIGAYVKKMTLNQIGEGNYFKILTNHFKGDLSKLKELGKYRGTSLDTIESNYNLNK